MQKMPELKQVSRPWATLFRWVVTITVICGPLDVLLALRGWGYYLSPIEQLQAAAWWIGYLAAIATIAGAIILLAASLALKVAQLEISTWAPRVLSCFGQIFVALMLARALRKWAGSIDLLPSAITLSLTAKVAIAAAIAGVIIYRTLIRRRPDPEILRSAPRLGILLALFAAPLMVYSLFVTQPLPSSSTAPVAQAVTRPNIILISVDTLSAQHMSLYGYSRRTTPHLEKWAKQMTVFDHFYANSNFTTCSMQSIMTGTLPWTHRAFQIPAAIDPDVVARGILPTLKQQSYKTLAVTTNAWASPDNLSLERYTDVQDAVPPANEQYLRLIPLDTSLSQNLFRIRAALYFLPLTAVISEGIEHLAVKLHLLSPYGLLDPRITFDAAQQLAQSGMTKPSLLWVHSMGPHAPYAAARPFLQSFDASNFGLTWLNSAPPFDFEARSNPNFPDHFVGRYDESVAANDAAIGEFLEFLVEQGLYENALIIITADHGESFGHGYGQHGGPELYEDLIHILLLIKLPQQKIGQRLSVPAQQADLLPTVRDVLGLPKDDEVEGRSLLSAIHGTLSPEPIFSMSLEQNRAKGPLKNGSVAMIEWPWKYVHYFGTHQYPQMSTPNDALYNIERDPHESSNLIETQSQQAQHMRAQIENKLAPHRSALQ